MVNANSELGQKTESKWYLLGYLMALIIGIAVGFGAGSVVVQYFSMLLAVICGWIVASIVAGGIMLLVCFLAGKWEDEITSYLVRTTQEEEIAGAKCGYIKANRGLVKYLLLSLITFNIYGIFEMTAVGADINTIAGRYDRKKTMNFCLIYFLLSWLTLGIAPIVWYHKISARIGNELNRRRIGYQFGAGTFWGWSILGQLILIGPWVYLYKLFTAMNLLSEHYNVNG